MIYENYFGCKDRYSFYTEILIKHKTARLSQAMQRNFKL